MIFVVYLMDILQFVRKFINFYIFGINWYSFDIFWWFLHLHRRSYWFELSLWMAKIVFFQIFQTILFSVHDHFVFLVDKCIVFSSNLSFEKMFYFSDGSWMAFLSCIMYFCQRGVFESHNFWNRNEQK